MMQSLTYSMNRWTTEQLIGEVMRRMAADGQALRLAEEVIIRARLAVGDRLCGDTGSPPLIAPAGSVRGRIEIGRAHNGESPGVPSIAGHEVDEGIFGAHTHAHAHGTTAPTKTSAHHHPHIHRGSADADGRLNGHIHAGAHGGLPWESGGTS
jgi:hypothetical protein